MVLIFPCYLSAQERQLKGKVTELGTGDPLPGATIQVENSTRGVTTDMDGTFEIRANSSDRLVVSFLGLETQTIEVGSQTYIIAVR